MKRLEEIKNEYAKQWYKDWNDLEIDCQFNIGTLIGHTDKVTELYAREVAQASLEKAAEKLVHFIDTYNADHSEIKLEITDEQNIVML
ncbi:hypothetical protein CMU68_10210 [Elizabethkingia anophelis]|nr:hypothetical protein [Elizabethkingia anophelis]MDV3786220.1 hypothetical protein [Elizabethkingia anophelis]